MQESGVMMPKTPKRTRAKVIEKPSRKQAAKRKEQIAMPENTTGQQPPQPPPQVATQAPIESKAKGQTPIPSEKSSLLDEWAKDKTKMARHSRGQRPEKPCN